MKFYVSLKQYYFSLKTIKYVQYLMESLLNARANSTGLFHIFKNLFKWTAYMKQKKMNVFQVGVLFFAIFDTTEFISRRNCFFFLFFFFEWMQLSGLSGVAKPMHRLMPYLIIFRIIIFVI